MNDSKSQIDELILCGRSLSDSCKPFHFDGINDEAAPSPVKNNADFVAWRARCIAFLKRVLGPDGEYVTAFETEVDTGKDDDIERGVALLVSFCEDFANGRLVT